MQVSPAAVALIKQFEGLRLASYICPSGVPTIGYGHTAAVALGQSCTAEQAEALLNQDLEKFGTAVATAVRVQMTQGQFDALVAWAFNVGIGNLLASTLLRKLNAGNAPGAAAEFARWTHAAGKVLPGLVARREAERRLFEA